MRGQDKLAVVEKNLQSVKYRFAIMSGKGGVGKTTFAAMLAVIFMRKGYRVGILDVDIHGPNIPRMFGVEDHSFQVNENERIIPITVEGKIKIASAAALGYGEDKAFIWRGPMKLGLIKQFLSEVEWGDTELLLIDTPPGTGDELLTVAEYLPNLTGSIIVSTPQSVSLVDARRSVLFSRETHLPIIGIVENMADSKDMVMFGSGGVKKIAEELQERFLGSVPLSKDIPGLCEGNIFALTDDVLPKSMISSIEEMISNSS